MEQELVNFQSFEQPLYFKTCISDAKYSLSHTLTINTTHHCPLIVCLSGCLAACLTLWIFTLLDHAYRYVLTISDRE